ncbi:MAG: hypothetical protein HY393_02065 [Candidatus Diapherotrites archaeon]|nr:hypothetical protein [Candidatus Diapherotrites archaeon]
MQHTEWLPLAVLLVGAALVLAFGPFAKNPINSYEECIGAGHASLRTYPASCETPEGLTFWQGLGDATIDSYTECAAAGNAIIKTLPPICRMPDGTEFRQLNDFGGSIDSFEECAAAYGVIKTLPPQCKTPDGKTFIGT